jgi:hypothetical protein
MISLSDVGGSVHEKGVACIELLGSQKRSGRFVHAIVLTLSDKERKRKIEVLKALVLKIKNVKN